MEFYSILIIIIRHRAILMEEGYMNFISILNKKKKNKLNKKAFIVLSVEKHLCKHIRKKKEKKFWLFKGKFILKEFTVFEIN